MNRKMLCVLIVLFSFGAVHVVSARPALALIDSPPSLGFAEIASGLSSPVSITNAGDSSGRLFITLQGGQVVIYDGSQILPTPFLDVSSLIRNGSEQGLLSVAFHPNYENNGYFYVYYTRLSDAALVIARYEVSADPNIADAGSASILLTIPHAEASNHNGGQLQFGPDGYLYIGTGDGGTGGAYSQDGLSLLGKMLRINVNGAAPYSIPADNPFVSDPSVADEIWALGLRNPWRFSFDSLTGDLIIADVGQNAWEEVNVQPASSNGGQNYGWPCYEGMHDNGDTSTCTIGTITSPVVEYEHGASDTNGCSISGGYRYRGSEFQSLKGVYLYGDFCTGRIWGAEPNNGSWVAVELADTDYGVTTFGEDENGELYVADFFGGVIYKIQATTFTDVPLDHPQYAYIEALYDAGYTAGCSSSPLMYCPDTILDRAQSAVFMLRGQMGTGYTLPPAPWDTFTDDWTGFEWAQPWAEGMYQEGLTGGCQTSPLMYCPATQLPRVEASVFGLRMKYGVNYTPPAATGTLFADFPATDPSYWAIDWAEQAYLDGLLPACGTDTVSGKPMFCPNELVDRGWGAFLIVNAKNLPLP
ncbi:MAG TPA: PQQ-dependent sugar dehydrogenase [Anaerolineales bacterium]|nr:PQQ-dependent sugar dehydrogenase [Anaerolineales bacterium]